MDIRRKLGFSLVALLVAVGLLEGLCRVLAPSGGLMQGALEPTEGDAQAIYMRGSPFLLWELAPPGLAPPQAERVRQSSVPSSRRGLGFW